MRPFGHGGSPSGEVWDACAACDFTCAAGCYLILLPFRHEVSPFGDAWDAYAAGDFASPAWGKGGLLGDAPLLGPLCTPPGTPLKKVFNFLKTARATRLLLRELPSLAPLAQVISLRAALCQMPLSP